MQLTPNTELKNGKYRIIRVLGQGGFGITYVAENLLLAKKIAIKEFFPKDFCGRDNTSHLTLGTQNNAETVAKLKDRFLKEARNIAKLDHPGIVKIHDVFEENNTAYYVMDYIEGENLNEMVKRNGPLTEAKAVEYIRKVGDALDYIHSRNMTHFDVKPANIVVRRSNDMPILIDFGLSKQYDTHGDATSTLMQGVSNGYSPIELYTAGSIATFSPQTDVYSLGATLYYLLTGKVPPAATEVLENGLSMPDSISETNQSAIKNAMAGTRLNRPQNITVFVGLLSNHNTKQDKPGDDTVLIGDVGGTSAPPLPTTLPNRGSNTKWLIGLATLIAIIIIVTMTGRSSESREDINTKPQAVTSTQDNPKSGSVSDGQSQAIDDNAENNNTTKTSSSKDVAKQDKSTTKINKQTSSSSILKVAKGSYSYGYATYNGELKNGKPHGKGRITFTVSHSDNKYGYSADAGDYIDGYFTGGSLDPGATLVKTDGSRKKLY